MKFIVAGCGFVGEPLRQQLLAAGHDTIGLTLSGSDETRASDVSDRDAVNSLASTVGEVDAIVHCASSGRSSDRVERYRSTYLEGCQNLLKAFPQSRLIFTSSTSVYAQQDGSLIDEQAPAEPSAATGKILRESEDLVLASGGSVARLAGIYGSGRSFLLKRYLAGEASIDGRWINQIHHIDAASALAFLLERPDTNGIFNVADNTPLWQQDCYEELSKRFNLPIPPEAEPDPNRKRGWTNKRVSNAKLRELGWQPTFPSYYEALDNDKELIPSIAKQT